MKTRRGFTLVETAVGVLLAALLLGIGFRLLSSGMRSSRQGFEVLTNLQAGTLLLSRIEADLQRARAVNAQPAGLRIEVVDDVRASGPVIGVVTYQETPTRKGLGRKKTGGRGPDEDHALFPEFEVRQDGNVPMFTEVLLAEGKYGVLVHLQVTGGSETRRYEKLVFCGNDPRNFTVPGWQGER
ncbi:MAG: hypothetical protein GX442_08465 [Candidatus Riflebacteria bacterium]|nr:hypothetical protein [Candidatus Riflebacteria bacterium]